MEKDGDFKYPGGKDTWVYGKGEPMLVTAKQAEAMYKEGYTDSPAKVKKAGRPKQEDKKD
jgi:hypothetical protein